MENLSHTYLALGDSYTIGESVTQEESFPYQLVHLMSADGVSVKPTVIAQTGWTTDELDAAIDLAAISDKFELVTLLIGVNNQYRGWSLENYALEFAALLQRAIGFSGSSDSVIVLSIPDWGVTPFGKASGKDIAVVSQEINQFNRINREIAERSKVYYADITPISRDAANIESLNASDGLHPSGRMYALWVDVFKKRALEILKRNR